MKNIGLKNCLETPFKVLNNSVKQGHFNNIMFALLGCVRWGNPDLDFENLNPDFPIERTLSFLLKCNGQTVELEIFNMNERNVIT